MGNFQLLQPISASIVLWVLCVCDAFYLVSLKLLDLFAAVPDPLLCFTPDSFEKVRSLYFPIFSRLRWLYVLFIVLIDERLG